MIVADLCGFRAIHRKVLVVYTEHDFGDNDGLWAAYVVPVDGMKP